MALSSSVEKSKVALKLPLSPSLVRQKAALHFHVKVADALVKQVSLPFCILQDIMDRQKGIRRPIRDHHAQAPHNRSSIVTPAGIEVLVSNPWCSLIWGTRGMPCLSEREAVVWEHAEIHIFSALRLLPMISGVHSDTTDEFRELMNLVWQSRVWSDCTWALLERRVAVAAGWALQLLTHNFFGGIRRCQDFALILLDAAVGTKDIDTSDDRDFLHLCIKKYLPGINIIHRYKMRAERSVSSLEIERREVPDVIKGEKEGEGQGLTRSMTSDAADHLRRE